MYIKIYFNDKPLFLCDEISSDIEPFLHHDDAVFIDELDSHTVKSMIHEMQAEQVHAGVFQHPDLPQLKKEFFKKFTLIKAGGGAVLNENQELLMIFRRGYWDLPKGKLDAGESIEDCAIREVREETGITEITRGDFLLNTWHTYHAGTKFILKESYWYAMKAPASVTLVPQTEEDIHEIKWVSDREIGSYLEKSFPSVRDVIRHIFP